MARAITYQHAEFNRRLRFNADDTVDCYEELTGVYDPYTDVPDVLFVWRLIRKHVPVGAAVTWARNLSPLPTVQK